MLSSPAAALLLVPELVFCMARKVWMLCISLWKLLSARVFPLEARRQAAIHWAYCCSWRPQVKRRHRLTQTCVWIAVEEHANSIQKRSSVRAGAKTTHLIFSTVFVILHFHNEDAPRSCLQVLESGVWWWTFVKPGSRQEPLHSLSTGWENDKNDSYILFH